MTTHYVDTIDGLDANNGYAPGTPWKTIARVNASVVGPGDAVLFKRGCTWTQTLTPPVAGTSGNRILFGAYGEGNLPVIDGTGRNYCIVDTAGRGYITINNLHLKEATLLGIAHTKWSGAEGSTPGWIVENCRFTHCGLHLYGPDTIVRDNVMIGPQVTTTENYRSAIIISGAVAANCCILGNTISGYDTRGIWFLNTSPSPTANDNIIDSCGMGIDFDGYGYVITGIVNCLRNKISNCVDLGVEFENCSDGSLFRGNWVNDCGRGLSYINYPLCARYAEQRGRDVNGEVSYNVLYHCNETISLQAVSAVNLWNNVIYDGIGTTPYGLYISDGDALSTLYAERIDCRNNIIGGGMSKSVFLTHAYSRIFSVFDYNAVQSALFFEFDTSTHLTLAQVQAAGKAMHCFTASPRFVDAPNHVFRELPDSPCVGAGVDVGLTQDHVGNVIVGFPDIGAYEYQEESVATKKTVLFTLAVTASPDFFPAILPTSLSVAKGVVAIYSVSFTAQGGFTGPVTLAVLNLPTGAVATFDKTSINVTETAILSITTVSVALGTFSLSVEGTANL